MKPQLTDRRTALKTIGVGIVGGVSMAGSASAHGTFPKPSGNSGLKWYPTWGDGDIWEFLDAEPPARGPHRDNEGNPNAHEEFFVIKSMEGTDVEGSEHSPQAFGVDHVVPVPGGPPKQFSAQWAVEVVVDPDTEELVNEVDENHLISYNRIKEADENGDVTIVPIGEVFTCPVRPHRD